MPQAEVTEPLINTSLRFPEALYTELKVVALRRKQNIGDVLADAARQYLASLPADPAA